MEDGRLVLWSWSAEGEGTAKEGVGDCAASIWDDSCDLCDISSPLEPLNET